MGRKKKQQRIVKEGDKVRNPYASVLTGRTGAGTHPNRRNVERKRACRGPVNPSDDT